MIKGLDTFQMLATERSSNSMFKFHLHNTYIISYNFYSLNLVEYAESIKLSILGRQIETKKLKTFSIALENVMGGGRKCLFLGDLRWEPDDPVRGEGSASVEHGIKVVLVLTPCIRIMRHR